MMVEEMWREEFRGLLEGLDDEYIQWLYTRVKKMREDNSE